MRWEDTSAELFAKSGVEHHSLEVGEYIITIVRWPYRDSEQCPGDPKMDWSVSYSRPKCTSNSGPFVRTFPGTMKLETIKKKAIAWCSSQIALACDASERKASAEYLAAARHNKQTRNLFTKLKRSWHAKKN